MPIRSKPTDDEVKALKAKYGDKLHVLSALGYSIIVTEPDADQYQMFLDYLNDDEKRSTAMKRLVDMCAVWPSPVDFEEMMLKKPGLYQTFGSETAKLAGFTRAVDVKRL